MRAIRRLRGEEDGALLVFVAISVAVLLGMVALSFDLGRMAATQTELQSFADNVALAAAGELDGRADSIDRARAAASSLITDTQTFGSGGETLDVTDFTLTFLSDLDGTDLEPPYDDTVTTDPAKAAFVRVDVFPHDVPLTFASAFGQLTGRGTPYSGVEATATAGYTQIACDITPLMFCLPPGFNAEAAVGTMIRLVQPPGNTWGPGNVGYLRSSGDLPADPEGACRKPNGQLMSGQELERCLLAAKGPLTACYRQNGVDLSPGVSAGSMAAALNVRFDLYDGTMNTESRLAAYGPALNVIRGSVVTKQGSNCTVGPSSTTVPLPRDDCFSSSCNGYGSSNFGNGNFSTGLANYIATNYGTAPAWFPTNPRTRYEIYLAEIAASAGGTLNILTGRQETGLPVCNRNFSTDPERRVVVAAGVDCAANGVNGAKDDVPVSAWVKVFLTEPVDPSGSGGFVEVIGSAQNDDPTGIIHDVVQLYR